MSIVVRQRLAKPDFQLDVDLALPGRGVTALFGPSGSGKTSLLRCIAGLEPHAEGHLEVLGEVWQDARQRLPTHRRALGYVFQDAALFPHLTVDANLRYGLRRTQPAAGAPDFAAVVALLDLAPLLARLPDKLSGGEKQRVAIGRALLTAPRLLLMDEPLAALDQARKDEILPYLERLHGELALPVLYVSHAADEVARLADHVVFMQAGRAVAQGPLSETLARLDLPVALGDDAGVVLDGVVALRDAQWGLARVDMAAGSLWVRDSGIELGRDVRVRIRAGDVSLALSHAGDSSIQNILAARVVALAQESAAATLVRLEVGGHPLLARVTRRAAHTLGLEPGQAVWAQVKAVVLVG